jgi:hypothetical protein
MRRGSALLLLAVTGCLHGGFHSFSIPSSAFHAASAATHVASAATAVAAVPRFHVPPVAVAAAGLRTVDAAAELTSDALSIAADVSAVEQFEPPSPPPVYDAEQDDAPYRELRWADSATAIAAGGNCPGLSNVPTESAILFRNAPVTLYVLSREPLDVTVTARGPVQVSRDGIALTVTPAGRLGETSHIEVFDHASRMRLERDLPTAEADAPCHQERRPLGQ